MIWEGTVGCIDRAIDPEMKPILKALFAELTLMGFIGLLLFIIGKTPILKILSGYIFGPGDENADKLTEQFETIHMAIFLVMSVFFVEIVVILQGGTRLTQLFDLVQEDIVDYNRAKAAEVRSARRSPELRAAAAPAPRQSHTQNDADGNFALANVGADLEADGTIDAEPISAHEDPDHPHWASPSRKHVKRTLRSEHHAVGFQKPRKMTAVNAYADRYRRARGLTVGAGPSGSSFNPAAFPLSACPSPVLWCPQCILQPDGTSITEDEAHTPTGLCAASWTRFQYEFASIRRRFISVPIDKTDKGKISAEVRRSLADWLASSRRAREGGWAARERAARLPSRASAACCHTRELTRLLPCARAPSRPTYLLSSLTCVRTHARASLFSARAADSSTSPTI